MAQKEFKKANFTKLFNYNVFFGNYLQYISWSVKNSKTVDTLDSTLTKRILRMSEITPARHPSSRPLFFKFSDVKLGSDFDPF